MKKNHFSKEYGSQLAFLAAAVALVLFVPAGLTELAGLRIFLVISIVFFLLCSAVLLFVSGKFSVKSKEVHYFLYDRRRKKSLSRDSLSQELIDDGMSFYLSHYVEDPLSLFGEFPKPLRLQLEGEPQFRVLIMYHILQLLSQKDADEIKEIFTAADERAISYLCRSLSECKDEELADYIYRLKRNAQTEVGRIPLFFKKNERRFATRAIKYVEQNFDRFFVDLSRFA